MKTLSIKLLLNLLDTITDNDTKETFSVKISATNDEQSKVNKTIKVTLSGTEKEVWEIVESITPKIGEIIELE